LPPAYMCAFDGTIAASRARGREHFGGRLRGDLSRWCHPIEREQAGGWGGDGGRVQSTASDGQA